MKHSVIRWVTILGAFAVAGIIGMQSYWVMATWNLNEDEFNKKVNLALYRVAQSLADLSGAELPNRDIVKQRTSNYYIVNVEVEIEDQMLEHLLQTEFQRLALNVDFEYAVFDCHTDEMVYGGFCTFSPDDERRNLELGNLPKDTEFTYYFGVKFPTRTGYLMGKMQLFLILSGILLLTIFFFVYAMGVILRQKRLSEMQKDFINNMTHEFKTPLSTIKIAAGVFFNDERVQADARLHRYAEIIMQQNQRLNNQVEKVLQIAKIEQDSFELKREPLALDDVLKPLLGSTSVQLEDLQGELVIDLQASQMMLDADRLHLTNILYSLLDNAIKYRSAAPVIRVATHLEGDQVMLTIEDNGIGIDKAYQGQVFEKFFRVPTGNVHNVKGFGLGLYYVKRICDAHGWRIRLQSELGQGTTVQLCLCPAWPAPPTPARPQSEEQNQTLVP
ncbi:MAG: HAMP domain-containing histidine kinase [Lewinella sp.]|nr:HAMP domain-containing histidine kinase [Lewinella sp.]